MECPICTKHEVLPPHGICAACLEHLKRQEIREQGEIEAFERKMLQRSNPDYTQETLDKNVAFEMKYEQEKWEKLTCNGLSASYLATIIIDEDTQHDIEARDWLYREAMLLHDLVAVLPERLFAPVTKAQMQKYLCDAEAYWNGTMGEAEREETLEAFSKILDKKTSASSWDVKSLPIWLMELPETDCFDWMLGQLMDCIYSCVDTPEMLSDEEWMKLFWQHFLPELKNWALKNKE